MTSAILLLAWTEIRTSVRRPLNLATGVIAPLMFLSLLMLPRLDVLAPDEATVAFTGVLLATLWTATLWSGASIVRRERAQGTLGALVTGRIPAAAAIGGKLLGSVAYDVVLIAATNVVFVVAYGVSLEIRHPLAFAIGMVAVVASGICTSFLLTGVLVLTRFGLQLTTLVNTPVLLLGGTIIPYSLLPAWIEVAGAVLNIAWLQRFLASTSTSSVDWAALGVAVGLSLAYGAGGALCLRVLLRRARKEATLEVI